MSRAVTLFTGQWADLPFATLCQKLRSWGYDGTEIACWGDHLDLAPGGGPTRATSRRKKAMLERARLKVFAIGATSPASAWRTCGIRGSTPSPADACKGKPEKTRGLGHRGDEVHRPGREGHGLQGGHRLHGLAGLEVLVLVPSDHRQDGGGGLRGDRRALDAHPGRVRRVRGPASRWRSTPPRSPSTSTPPSGCSRPSSSGRPWLQLRPQPPHTGRG